jgi:wyosine [tRNA(Phe)-imidazoG37] synthetase (radical SAM superfamily)
MAVSYIYGPVKSWRSGTSLGIDPIGEISTCSFNCAYCQLGQIQNRTAEVKIYVPTEKILKDFTRGLEAGEFRLEELDVITFAGSGEPTLAENLGEIIEGLREIMSKTGVQVPISILTNATLFHDDELCKRALKADMISLKLDAPNDEVLKSINQPVEGVTVASIISGIKNLMSLRGDCHVTPDGVPRNDTELQMQIMIMPKFAQDESFILELAQIVKELGVKKIQINTPTRAKPVSKTGEYWIETRGNHYAPGETQAITPDYIEFKELPAIDKETAFYIEEKFREVISNPELEVVNVYQRI